MLNVLVWNEGLHEKTLRGMDRTYPSGIHGAIAEGLAECLPKGSNIRTATLSDPEQGLGPETLADVDVLLWWGHMAHDQVSDDAVDRIHQRVLAGMGLLVLHSGHFSKIFKKLMGTTCSLLARNSADRELIWTVNPTHPIAQGVKSPIAIEQQEMYGEFFDIPAPDELIFISSFSSGEVFRSGATFRRGFGKVFYFSPGDEAYPVYHHPQIRRVLANAVLWATPERRVGSPPEVSYPEVGWLDQ
jgi:trehalose utilization protein